MLHVQFSFVLGARPSEASSFSVIVRIVLVLQRAVWYVKSSFLYIWFSCIPFSSFVNVANRENVQAATKSYIEGFDIGNGGLQRAGKISGCVVEGLVMECTFVRLESNVKTVFAAGAMVFGYPSTGTNYDTQLDMSGCNVNSDLIEDSE
ncbi:hypothetical protein AKJ16_DCAP25017 [Drosera capensis]